MSRKLSIEDMQQIAKERGGKCLSKEYVNAKTKLEWKCKVKDHPSWLAAPSRVRRGSWCRKCADKLIGAERKLTVEDMQQIAKERGGKCLSKEYVNANSALEWKCKFDNHPSWWATPGNIKSGQWCKQCKGSFGETLCRIYFERITGRKFPSKFPTWLRSTDGNLLELDGFNKNLNIAFEHQGRQHYDYIKQFHRSPEVFAEQQSRDAQKRQLCENHGVHLIEIPEVGYKTPIDDLEKFILNELKSHNMGHVIRKSYKPVCVAEAYTDSQAEGLLKARAYAASRGGKCLSTVYVNAHHKLEWECKKGHRWKAVPQWSSSKWCKRCSAIERGMNSRLTIEEMHQIAKARGGKCLSNDYASANSLLEWKCKVKDHPSWWATPGNIKSGQWCPVCGGTKKLTIEDMQQIAKERGGKCLSKEYVNANTKLEWKCKVKNHPSWWAIPNSVKRGRWCKECAGLKKLTIEDMQQAAKERGGKCLSKTYVNNRTKLEWKCGVRSHDPFLKDYDHVKRGQWCPQCRKKSNILNSQKP